MDNKVREIRNKKKKRMIVIVAMLIVLCAGGWLLLHKSGLQLDPDQSEGSLDGMSEAQIKELMQQKVDEGNLMISINTQPVFESGTSKGTLRIENSPQNRYLIVVKIYLKGKDGKEGEKIYESGAIKPGNKIEKAALDKDLKKGVHPVIVYFEGYDAESKEYIGKAASELSILVKE